MGPANYIVPELEQSRRPKPPKPNSGGTGGRAAPQDETVVNVAPVSERLLSEELESRRKGLLEVDMCNFTTACDSGSEADKLTVDNSGEIAMRWSHLAWMQC